VVWIRGPGRHELRCGYTHYLFVRDGCNSAKEYIVKDDIVPESNYVIVSNEGECMWFPFYGRTASHCSVDTTWFPFDVQHCQLVYASWKHTSDQVNLTTSFDNGTERGILLWVDFEPSDEWELISECLRCLFFTAQMYRVRCLDAQ